MYLFWLWVSLVIGNIIWAGMSTREDRWDRCCERSFFEAVPILIIYQHGGIQ